MRNKLHKKQSLAFTSKATEILYGGAAGGGKSHLMRIKAIALCMQIPNLQVYLFRRKSEDLKKNHMEGDTGFPALLSDMIESKHVKVRDKSPHIKFWNHSGIHLCHCQHEKDKINYQGAEIHVLLIDELTHFTDSIYRYLRGRCRLPKSMEIPDNIKLPLIICGSNPGGVGHNWVKASWVDKVPEMEILQMEKEDGGMLRQYIPARLEDNPSLDEESYKMSLSGLGDEWLVRAMLDGDWNIVAGGMFDDVWRARNIVKPFEIPDNWKIYRTFDWGSSKPFSVGWHAEANGEIDDNVTDALGFEPIKGDIFRIGEWYGWNGNPDKGIKLKSGDIAKGIIERESKTGWNVQAGAADSAIWTKQDETSIYEKMCDAVGVELFTPCVKGPGSRVNGWQTCREFLSNAEEKESPAFYCFDTCRQFIRTVPVLPRDDKNIEDVDTHAEDHIADEWRYMLTSVKHESGAMNIVIY